MIHSAILLPCLAILLSPEGVHGDDHGPGDCCMTKTVTNSPDPALDGEYSLKEDEISPREDVCVDGCIYEKDGDEFCFIEKPKAESADVVCEGDSSGSPPPSGESTTPGSPPPSGESTTPGSPPPSGESTTPGSPPPSGESTTPAGSTTPESADSLKATADAAAQEKDRAQQAIADATAEKEAAEGAGAALDDVAAIVASLTVTTTAAATTTAGYRAKRQATTTAWNFEKPDSCSAMVDAIANIAAWLSTDIFKALALVDVLKTVTPADVTCTPSEAAAATTQVTAAKEEAVKAVAVIQNVIAAETAKFNEAIAKIEETNTKLQAIGEDTVAPGTPLPSVATVFVETTMGASPPPTSPEGGSSPDGSSPPTGGSTPDGSPPPTSPDGSSPGSPPASSPDGSSPPMSTSAPGGRRARGVYLKHFGIEI